VLVIDEAGSVRARQMEQALRLAEQAGARVVLLGDTRQTKAIEAGRPFDQLHGAGMATALMQQIERQKDPTLREAVRLAAKGKASASLARIREIPDDRQRRQTIANDYARLPAEELARTIVVAAANSWRHVSSIDLNGQPDPDRGGRLQSPPAAHGSASETVSHA
jgi:ATP-dependent exoDNAse (exonuclease V) alpha subunit